MRLFLDLDWGQCWNRVFESRVTGSPGQRFRPGRDGSGHGSVWQVSGPFLCFFLHTLCCFFCGENTPFSILNSKHRHSVPGSGHRVKSVRLRSDHGSKVQSLFHLRVRILNVFIALQNAKACIAIYCCSVSVCCMYSMFHTPIRNDCKQEWRKQATLPNTWAYLKPITE